MDDPVVMLRVATATVYTVAFVGLSVDLKRRKPSLTDVVRWQYYTYYLLILVTTSMVLARVFTNHRFVMVEVALFAVGALAAVTSNWRLHRED